ncbi:MAG: hypothetical protein SF052_17240 [Bacteroidia bacterium]|nr:hypothetical protein [Bacteroidia bacterium]
MNQKNLVKVEKVLLGAFAVGLLLQFFAGNRGRGILAISLFCLSMLYFGFSGILFRNEKTAQPPWMLIILSGILFSIGITGIMFGLLHFGGAGLFLLFSGTTITSFLVPYLFYKKYQDNIPYKFYYNSLLARAIPIGILCILIYALIFMGIIPTQI